MAIQAFLDQPVPGPKRDYIGYGRYITKVRWPNNARVAINIVLNYEEGSEYTHPAGDKKNDGLTEIPFYVAAIVKPLFPCFPALASFFEELCHLVLISLYACILVPRSTSMAMGVNTIQSRDDPYHHP